MEGLFCSIVICILLIITTGCNNQKIIINENDGPIIEIQNFDARNFIHSKPSFGSEINVYKSDKDSVTILVKYEIIEKGLGNYFSEEVQKDR